MQNSNSPSVGCSARRTPADIHGAEDRIKYTSKYDDLKRLLTAGGHQFFEPYLPLSQAVNGKVADLYRDPGHYTPRGHDLLAEILIKYIQERKLLELTLKSAK